MADARTTGSDIATMIADYMEKGFLDNIVDMFKHDATLYGLVGTLIQDERVRVRIGITAMMEELRAADRQNISRALPGLLPLAEHGEPVVRGDVSNLLGIIGDKEAMPFLEKLLDDENPNVRLITTEAIAEIRQF